jgi:hypothetical protein
MDTLQIDVSVETRLLLSVWGYAPKEGWTFRALPQPRFAPGGLRVKEGAELIAGVSIRNLGPETEFIFDPTSGWFCAKSRQFDLGNSGNSETVLFASDTCGLILDGYLEALFIRPENWTNLR